MGSGLLSTGVSGLIASQRALQTVSHNVSNANTDGYSRQRVELGARAPQFSGGGYLGQGVEVKDTERIYNNFLDTQVKVYTSSYQHADVYSRQATLVDELLADPEVGMMPAIEDYFGAVHDVSTDPASIPARQAFLTQAETLADRFQYIDQRLTSVRDQVNSQVSDYIEEINSLAESIAAVNQNIARAPGNQQPNDLLDERSRLLNRLSEKVAVNTVEQDDGSVNVFIGNGQTLVVGFNNNELHALRNEFDISQLEVGVDVGGGAQIEVTSLITGGALGGVLEFRSELLDPAQNALGHLAMGMAVSMNDQHSLGQDLNGNLGADLFNVAQLQVLPGSGVPGGAVSATLDNVSDLTDSEYLLSFDGGGVYTLTRLSDNTQTALGAGVSPPIDGFTLNIAGGMAVGDQVLIRPTRSGAADISTLIIDPREVAAALPVMTYPSTANTGNGSITPGNVTDDTSIPLAGDITLTYSAGTNEISVAGAVPAAGPFTYSSGSTIAFNGMEYTVAGALADGDQFTITTNPGGVSDNRNALTLAGLQNATVMDNNTATYQDVYGQLVADVGINTSQAVVTKDAQSNLLDQAMSAHQGYSGVNLDEEAADLIKYQQAYQASAQVITTANAMFDALLNAVRR